MEDDREKHKLEKDDIILITERGTDPIFSELIGSAVSSNNLKRNNQEFKQKSKDFDETFCGGASDLGFCALTPSEHIDDQLEIANQILDQPDTQDFNLDHLMKKCQHITDIFAGYFIPNLEDLGDTSEFVHSPEETGAPWSWKSYQYKKKQICSSQLSFILPAYAKEVQGTWYRIVQTDEVRQKVALDICTDPGLPCPGISDCGNKSVCTQRYTYQFLLSVQNSLTDCPKIRAFKFPTGCVCHMEF
ncbi:uncharacterized protein LOC111702356 [Eurytemora carolleeae]|uniref:uncharacterized protein LOC111702356 n=1 Tax=Eurytemora carolleeae TaxID=1294199 RepID=UPI000C791007|nr:uncharacterized protein LOC111702356 [Eurytemora carolleeae]|eukprot:XP_023329782.1 uncharacterized protein LOC111702356 [Eurytemora affinis]